MVIGAEIDYELKQSLLELLCFFNSEEPADEDYIEVSHTYYIILCPVKKINQDYFRKKGYFLLTKIVFYNFNFRKIPIFES